MSDHPLDPIFHPRAIALVGVSSKPTGLGGMVQRALMESGFDRKRIYPVNPKISEAGGLRCYPTLLDTPDPVDHVISMVPARVAPGLVDQCVEKGVRSVHFFTAGFSETGDEEMTVVEQKMIATLRAAGIRAIGPNCMGLYVPESGLSFSDGFPREPGNVFMLSQSGWNASDMVRALAGRGIRFSKVISFGNGADLKAHDFFDYATSDPATEVVVAYIEGVQDGRALLDAVRRCAALKPTIILKGGLTGAGARAANSHTGSLAGSTDVFEALCRQTGALRAESLVELQDLVVAATTSARLVAGDGVALFGGPGGFAVLSADALARAGLQVPPMPELAKERLREFIPIPGTSVDNPIDVNLQQPDLVDRAMRIVAEAEPIDVVFAASAGQMPMDRDIARDESGERIAAFARNWAERISTIQEETGVPFLTVQSPHSSGDRTAEAFQQAAADFGLALMPTIERAAHTVVQLLEWRKRRAGLPPIF